MPASRDEVSLIVQSAIDDLNGSVPADQQLAATPDTPLLGPDSVLDSLGLVTLIFSIEKCVDAKFGVPVAVGNQVMTNSADSPIRTVSGLIDYITQQIADQQVPDESSAGS